MKSMRYFFLCLLVSCSSAKVISDYDSQTDFSAYKTYAFFEDTGNGLNELDIRRLQNAIKSQLALQGFKEVENPDVFINFISKKEEVQNKNTIGVGIGGGGGNVGFGVSGGIPIGGKRIIEEITIELVAAKTDHLIWQGVLASRLKSKTTPEKRNILLKEVAQKILMTYPPKK